MDYIPTTNLVKNLSSVIKQFADIKTKDTHKLFFVTNDNKIYEMFGSDINFATCSIYVGEWSSADARSQQKANYLYLIFSDVMGSGVISIQAFVDKKLIFSDSRTLTQSPAVPNPLPLQPPFGVSNTDTVKSVTFPLQRIKQGWKVGFYITWNFNATLTNVRVISRAVKADNSDEQASKYYK